MSPSIICSMLFASISVTVALYAAREEKPLPSLPGTCPDFPPAGTSLNGSQIVGDWFNVYSIKKGFENINNRTEKCIKKTMTPRADGRFDTVLIAIKGGQQKNITGIITPNPAMNGKYTFQEDIADDPNHTLNVTGTLLGTDYTGFLVSVLCGTDGTNHGFIVAVYSRKNTLEADKLENVQAVLKIAKINEELKATESC